MEPILDDLLTRWQEAPDRSPEDICKEHPELLLVLVNRIEILKRIERLAETDVVVPCVPVLPGRAGGPGPRDN